MAAVTAFRQPRRRPERPLDERVGGTLQRAGPVANVGGAVVAFLLLAVVQAGDDVPRDRRAELGVVFAVFLTFGMVVAATVLSRYVAPVVDVLRIGGQLKDAAWERLFRLPIASGVISTALWFLAAPVFAIHSVTRLGNSGGEALRLATILVLAGLTAGASMYLLVDRGLRPVYAAAFAARTPRKPEGVAVAPRLMLVWFVGSAVPLLITGLIILSPDVDDVSALRRDSLPWVLLGLVLGGLLSAGLARSLAAPLTALRGAMAEVRQGGFAVRVDVDDATEVGVLQAGFNDMASGLQERERLQDLFGRHVGEDVARRALERGAVLGGEVVPASVLFLDLIGSTSLALRLPPEQVVALLNDVFEAVVTAAERERGWVNKFEGDAALCVFGPPGGEPDHATRALRAARSLRRSLSALAEAHDGLDAAVGVSSGTVVAGNVGSERRFEYTVIGDPVNEAARLTEAAKAAPGRVLGSGVAVASAAEVERCHWRHVGSERLRGRTELTELWEPAQPGDG